MPRRDAVQQRTAANARGGRRTALTPRTADTLVNAVREGNHLTTACRLAGVGRTTLYRWIRRADAVDYAIRNGQPYNREDLKYPVFRDRLIHARAEAADLMVSVILQAAAGGYVIEEEPALDANGKAVRDDDGSVVWRRRYAPPDGPLALKYLARAQPENWNQTETTVGPLDGDNGRSPSPAP